MFLPYGLLKADEALSCKAGVGQAQSAQSEVQESEMRIKASYKGRILFLFVTFAL